MSSRHAVAQAGAMVSYRRNRALGGTYFFTVTLHDRRSDLLVRRVDVLRASWRAAKARVAHEVIASVVLPDHLHAVLTMGDGVDDYSRLWQDIKKGFTRRLRELDPTSESPWQPRFWEHTIANERDLAAHVDYIHINPLKHGLVQQVREWPYSSFHRYVARGWLSPDWASVSGLAGRFGER
jgi:putative transposase